MREDLKFIELVKVDNVFNIYKLKDNEQFKAKVEFIAVYLCTKSNSLEFFPIEITDLLDGYKNDEYNEYLLETVDLSHSHYLPITDEDRKNNQIKYLFEKNIY